MPSRADSFVWTLMFITLGTLLILNRPVPDSGGVVAVAVVSYAAAAFFAFLLIVKRA